MSSEPYEAENGVATLASPLHDPAQSSYSPEEMFADLASPFDQRPEWNESVAEQRDTVAETEAAWPPPAEMLADEHSGEAAMGAGSAWAHRLTEGRPLLRRDVTQGGDAVQLEQQKAPPGPTVSRAFSPQALAELPDVLQAKPLVRLEATVPTERVLWMIQEALRNRGTRPGWADRLLVDLRDLPKAGPSSTVHVSVFKTVPFELSEVDKLEAFHRYSIRQYGGTAPPIDALTVGQYWAHRTVEDLLQLPAGSIAGNAGLPSQPTASLSADHKIVIYAVLPRSVGAVIAPMDHRSLRGFDFGKWLLTAEHERLLDSLAREIVRSWFSRSIVTRIVAAGHTDPVGARDFNIRLGRHRAEAVVKRLRELIDEYAASVSFPAGVLDKIQYEVESYGEDRPFSRTMQTLNRRVEVTVYRDSRPPPQPLDADTTFTRQAELLKQSRIYPETAQRLQCLLQKVRQPGADDRYVNDTQVFLIKRDNKVPTPTEWNRVRSALLDPRLFSPQLPDDRIIANLERLDEDIAGGIVKMNQIIDYASGAEWGLGLLALPTAFKQFNAWVMERFKDPSSVYSCYADLFT